MAECDKCKPESRSWCYLVKNISYIGTYAHSCEGDKISDVTYKDSDGNIVDPADFNTVDCIECENPEPVHICNMVITPTTLLASPACFRKLDGEKETILLQAILKEMNGDVTTIGHVDGYGNVVDYAVEQASPCDCKCEDCEE